MIYLRAIQLVTYQVLFCWFYRLRYCWSSATHHIPRNSRKATSVWFVENIKASDKDFAGKIERIEFEAVGSQTTDRSLARIIFKCDESLPAESYFIKSRALDFATGLFGAVFDLGLTEVRFYQQIHPEVPVKTPRPLFSNARNAGGDFVLVMERLEGDDVYFKTVVDSATLLEAEKVIDALAALHAHFWQDRRFETKLSWLQTSLVERAEVMGRPLRKYAFNKVLSEYAMLFPKEVSQNCELLQNVVLKVNRHNHTRPETLLHGDPHLGNMYFQNGEVGFLDWQVMQRGCCMKDVSYFMIMSMPVQLRQTHQHSLIERYVARLIQNGVTNYSLDEAMYDYRINSIHPFIAAVFTAASNTMQGPVIVKESLLRASSALIDLNSIEFFHHLNAI